MLQKFKTFVQKESRQLFKAEDSRFMLFTGLKVSGISLTVTVFIYYFIFTVMRLNYAFFKANGFPGFDSSIFYDSVMGEALSNLPILFLFHIFLFFIGYYVGLLMLRPFRVMGEYCEEVMENPNAIYKVEDFSTYRLLTRFSEFFFEYLRESRNKGEIITNSIPPQYSRVHKPVLDKVFMLHFGLLLVIIAICSSIFIVENASSIFENMIELATKTLKHQSMFSQYFSEQEFVLDHILMLTIVLIAISYILLGLHLYSQVSGAAFGIFSTMRAYMKGNYFSRVHLVGYSHIRDYTRKLNKYLEYVENNLTKQKTKG